MADEPKTEAAATPAPEASASKKKPFPLTAENAAKVLSSIKQGTAPAMELSASSLALTYDAESYAARTSADAEALRKAFALTSSCVDALPMGSQRVTFAL